MNDNELLAAQAEAIAAANPGAKVFTYRNLVKALPWFSEVREACTLDKTPPPPRTHPPTHPSS